MDLVPLADKLVWARVVRPCAPLVYLDLNHYINLAKANIAADTAPSGYPELLSAATAAVRERRAIFPLSGEHLLEVSAIKDPRQRRDVAQVMESLSGFGYLLGRPEIAQLEIEAGIEDVLGESPQLPPLPLIGPSFAWAFGKIGGLKITRADGTDGSGDIRRAMGNDKYEDFMRTANRTIERGMLDGPPDEAVPALRRAGYEPESAEAAQESRLAFELELSTILTNNPKWRRGRLRDLVSAREIHHEWGDIIHDVMQQRVQNGRPSFDPPLDELRRFMAAMPHTQVAISMKTRYHHNPEHRWRTNHIADIDALSVAYAYCDAVFTDKEARAALGDSKELRVLDTYLPRKVRELIEWLDSQPRLPAPDLLVPSPRNRV